MCQDLKTEFTVILSKIMHSKQSSEYLLNQLRMHIFDCSALVI